ncbi:MAG: hypothetical protein ACUVX9_16460 [Anaerolineae bacterium]
MTGNPCITPRRIAARYCALMALAAACLAACRPAATPTPVPVPTAEPTAAVTIHVAASWVTVKALPELVAQSTVIVVGRQVGVGGVFNAARMVSDHSQPDPQLYGVAQVYQLQVERYLKGSGPETLDYAQVEGYIEPYSGEPTLPTIEAAKSAWGEVPPVRAGVRYLFFLRPMGLGYLDDQHLTGTVCPSRFVLTDDDSYPETPWTWAGKFFPHRPPDELVAEVEQLVAAEQQQGQ